MIGLLNIVVGGGLLLAGRKLFWFLVGAIGFMIGLEVAARLGFRSELLMVLAALALGAVFALMAVFLESVAIGMAGFLGGGVALMRVGEFIGLDHDPMRILTFVIGGIVGVVLVIWLFNWALITISSVAGASMIVGALSLRAGERPLLLAGLVLLGVLLQGLSMHRERTPRRSEP